MTPSPTLVPHQEQGPEVPPQTVSPPAVLSSVGVKYPTAALPRPTAASLRINNGDRVLLLGPSACGKSSLALTINGLIPGSLPARVYGRIEVYGEDVSAHSVSELSRHVGMVFQDVDSQIIMNSVLDEVAFGPENLCCAIPQVEERTKHALKRVGLWERRFDAPASLSGGQKQRLSIACSLALGAPLLVLDEPTANLDPANTEVVYSVLKELTANGHSSILLIEHNIDAALALINRVVVLDQSGATCFDGSPKTVFGNHGAELAKLGVRLPAPTRLALDLQTKGLHFDQLPITRKQLRDELARDSRILGSLISVPNPTPCSEIRKTTFPPAVEFNSVTVAYGRRTVLKEMTFQIQRGEFIGIAGVNGSGKTTLLQAIAGLLKTVSGDIKILSASAGQRPGYVFQNPEHQFVAETVEEEIAISLNLGGIHNAQHQARINQYLERFGLIEVAQRHPFLLSGGQKRRLSVVTALIEGTDILLLDEPTFGQDQTYSDELMSALTELHRSGSTIIMVSHDLDLLAQHSDRVFLISEGKILSDLGSEETFADEALLLEAGLRVPPMAATLNECGLPQGYLQAPKWRANHP